MLLRIFHDRLKRGIDDRYFDQMGVVFPWRIGDETLADQFALMARTLGEIEHLPRVDFRVGEYARFGIEQRDWNTPEADAYLAKLETSPIRGGRDAAARLRKIASGYAAAEAKARPTVASPAGDRRDIRGALDQLAMADDPETRKAAETLRRKLGSPPAVVEKSEVTFRTLGEGDGTHAGPVELTGFVGGIPAGKGVDLFWRAFFHARVCLLKGGGRWSTVVSKPDAGAMLGTPCFDGRYAWVPVLQAMNLAYRPPSLIVIDPESGRTWEVTTKDGLPFPVEEGKVPPGTASLAVAPIAPGQVLAAGTFGPSWLATIAFEPKDGPSVKVVHEARVVTDPGNLEFWKDTSMSFFPDKMGLVVLGDQVGEKAARRVMIGRRHGQFTGHPLLVDPETFALDVMPDYVRILGDLDGQARDGGMFWAETANVRSHLETTTADLYRVGFPDFKPTVVAHRVYEGKARRLGLAFDGDRTLVVGDELWSEDAPGAGFRRLGGSIPEAREFEDQALARSQNLGLLLLREMAKPYQVRISDRPGER